MSKVTSCIEIITPAMAAMWLKDWNYNRQRQITARNVETYAQDMRAGRWGISTIDVVIVNEPAQTYLVNGYHRLGAVVLSQTSQEFNVVRRYVDTTDELHDEYSTIDLGRKRTMVQVAIGMGLDEEFEIPPTLLARFLTSAGHIHDGLLTGYIQSEEMASVQGRTNYAATWKREMRIAYDTIGYADKYRVRKLYTAGVLPIVLVTFRFQRMKAFEFWTSVATLENLHTGHPALTISDWIVNHRVSVVEYRRFWWAVTRAWNAYCEGRDIETLRALGRKGPLDIWGTPYTGREVITGNNLLSVEEWARRSRPQKIEEV